jgi:hypothetical protein
MTSPRSLSALLAIVLVFSIAEATPPVDFDTEIIPVLTRHGCNAGSCHGAAIGRGGFKLSLLGSDAIADHDAIARQLEGRRINLHNADRSLVLLKPSEQTGHEGGYVLPETSVAFETLHRWIDEGGQRLRRRNLVALEVSPSDVTLDRIGATRELSITATFDDGTTHDVTDQTVVIADDPDAVQVDLQRRTLTVIRRGVHVVIARYLDRVMPIRLTVPLQDAAPRSASHRSANRIDEYINAQLDRLNVPASPPADDFAFLRRVTLDLTGRLPTPDQLRRFVADDSPRKRSKWIGRLLDDESFAQYWALKWANVLQIDSKQIQPEGAAAFHGWLLERLRRDAPMDESARLMLTSLGDSYVNGAANFSRTGSSPGDLAEHASRVFMGVRLRCANCHNHPLDHWQQDDYHGLAAIFAKVGRGQIVTLSERGEVTHPETGQPAIPRIPGERYLPNDVDGRVEFAQWLTSKSSPYLARVTVNRVWQQLIGRGLVEPVDDLRVTNPATHPELLDWLAQDFVSHGFRLKHTIALICNSAAYQRSSSTVSVNESDSQFCSHAISRPLEAEVIADAIGDVTGIPLPTGQAPRAVALTDNRFESPSLDVLGRCDRSESCVSLGISATSLTRSLHLINGPLINQRLAGPDSRLHQLLQQNDDDSEVLNELYLLTLCRTPTPVEREHWMTQMASVDDGNASTRASFFEDLLWALMTSDTFITNH